MEDKTKKEILDLFIQAYNKVIKPDLASKEDIHQELFEFRSDIMTKVDAVYKEVLTTRQEQTMHTNSHDRMNEKMVSYEKRLKDLEYKVIR